MDWIATIVGIHSMTCIDCPITNCRFSIGSGIGVVLIATILRHYYYLVDDFTGVAPYQ